MKEGRQSFRSGRGVSTTYRNCYRGFCDAGLRFRLVDFHEQTCRNSPEKVFFIFTRAYIRCAWNGSLLHKTRDVYQNFLFP
jgi:hypothetical protein